MGRFQCSNCLSRLGNISSITQHFETAAGDPLRHGRERAIYSGLASRLSTQEFVQNLALMYNAPEQLNGLSLELQKEALPFPLYIGLSHVK